MPKRLIYFALPAAKIGLGGSTLHPTKPLKVSTPHWVRRSDGGSRAKGLGFGGGPGMTQTTTAITNDAFRANHLLEATFRQGVVTSL